VRDLPVLPSVMAGPPKCWLPGIDGKSLLLPDPGVKVGKGDVDRSDISWRCRLTLIVIRTSHMAAFVILSRVCPEAFDDPRDFKDLAKSVSEKIQRQMWPDYVIVLFLLVSGNQVKSSHSNNPQRPVAKSQAIRALAWFRRKVLQRCVETLLGTESSSSGQYLFTVRVRV
jgi:hypothetical protein